MNKNRVAEIIVILEITLIIPCFWFILEIMEDEGANNGATKTETLGTTAEGGSKGPKEKGITKKEIHRRERGD